MIAAAPVTDTIKQASQTAIRWSGRWTAPASGRSRLPQAFRADALREALSDPDSLPEATDDAMLVERRGGRVLIHSALAGQHQGDDPDRSARRRVDSARARLGSLTVEADRKRALGGAALTVAALGVVFGDIGTSPIYTIQTAFNPATRIRSRRRPTTSTGWRR